MSTSPAYSRPEVRAVLDDATLERGGVPSWGWLTRLAADAAAYADAADDDAADDADDADAAAAADAADDADAAADAADDDAADAEQLKAVNEHRKGNEMREGLILVQLPGRGYWSVTRVGWARRVDGDEWELVGAVTVLRTGASRSLASLAEKGPGKDHQCGEPDKLPELLHRFTPRRVRVADEGVWKKYVGTRP